MQYSEESVNINDLSSFYQGNLPIIPSETALLDAIALMQQNQGNGCYVLIIAEEKLIGIFTEQDLIQTVASVTDLSKITIAEVMRKPITLKESQCKNIFQVWSFLKNNSLRYLPIVTDDEKLLGLVSSDSLVQKLNPQALESVAIQTNNSQNQENFRDFFENSVVGLHWVGKNGEILWANQAQLNLLGYKPEEYIGHHIAEFHADADVIEDEQLEELEEFFAITPSILCIAGMDGYFKRLNPAFTKTLGFTAEELRSEPFLNFVHPEDRGATIAEVEKLSQGKTTISFENRYRTKNGSYRWFLWTAKPDLKKQRIYALAQDITSRKETELALIESEERWQLALRGANDGIWDWNVKTNEVFFSKRWKEMLGFTEDEISNTLEEWSKRVHPDDLAWITEVIQEHFTKKTPFYISEHRVLCKDGSYKWILDRGQALWDEQDNVIRMTGSHTDISARKEAEFKLQQERDFNKAILDTVGALVTVLDREGKIVIFNHTCEQITGYSFLEVKDQAIWDFLIIPEERKTVKSIFKQLLKGKLPNQYENYWRGKNGEHHLISWSNTALFDPEGKIEFIIATGIDITQQRQVQEKLEHQYRQTHLLAEVTRKIRMSIELDTILQTAVTEVQNLLACDRVMVVKLNDNGTVTPISEAIITSLPSMLDYQLADPLLMNENLVRYSQGNILAIPDIAKANIPNEVKILLQQFAIKAKLVVPILSQNQLKGLLIAHQCNNTRQWKNTEIKLLQQLADQLGVALSQAQLLNNLEELVQQRTLELTVTNHKLESEIQQRQLIEVTLRENQQKLAGILDNADEGIISIDQQQRIILFNQGAEKIFGYSAKELMGQPLDILIPEVFQNIHHQHIEKFAKSPNFSRTMADRNSPVFGCRKHGEHFAAEASISKLKTRDGLIFTVMLRDITERLQAEAKIRRSEEQLRLITDSLPILIAYVDDRQCYHYNNRTYETWFGKSREELNGLSVQEVVGETNYRTMLPYIKKALSGQAVTFEMQCLNNRRGNYWVNATYIPDFDSDDQVKGFFAMIEDITERKAIERLKSEFVSVASHEMRTPLTSIHGVLKLIDAGHLGTFSERGQEMIGIALKNTDRLIRLINDVLDIERMESGLETIEREKCNSAELIQQAVATMMSMAQQNQITIEADLTPIELWVDSDRIIQTLTNLLSNAIKFSPVNSKVWVSCQKQEKEVLFIVKDQGRGIPPDKLETIFERFQQVDASDSRKKGGTGLGLAICLHIIQQHGGKIWVDSTLDKGSTFFFTVPQSL